MVVELVVELIPVKGLNLLPDQWLDTRNLFVHLVVDEDLVDLLFVELDHQNPILVGPLIKKVDHMQVNGLVKDDVLYLPFGLADNVTQLIVVEEKKLKLNSVVFQEL